jgi:hypothetical protein
MLHNVMVRWTRTISHGRPIDRWFTSAYLPRKTEELAQIERIDGEWWLTVFRAWAVQKHLGLKTQKVRYLHPKTAKSRVLHDALPVLNPPRRKPTQLLQH